MADSYPTLGIRLDLNDIVRGRQTVRDFKGDLIDLGKTRDSVAKAGVQSATNAGNAERAQMSKTIASAKDMFTSRFALTRQMFADQARAEKEAAQASARSAQDSLAFNMRMTRQRAAEAMAAGRVEEDAARATSAAQQRAAQDAFAFNMRLTRQRVAEAQAAGREEAASAEAASRAQRRADQDVLAFKMRMNRQRAAEEQATLRNIQAAEATASKKRQTMAREDAEIERRLMERNAAFRAELLIEQSTKSSFGATRQQKAGLVNLFRQVQDVFTQLGSGQGVGITAIQQGPQIFDALTTSGFKFNAQMLIVGGTVALVTGAVIAGTVAMLQYQKSMKALTVAAAGLGASSGSSAEQLSSLASSSAAAGDVSVKAAREMAAAYANTGRIGGQVLGDLIEITKTWGLNTGQTAKEATGQLAKAFADPAKGAKELNDQFHFLSASERQHIQDMAESGRVTEAQQALVDGLRSSMLNATDATTGWAHALSGLATAASNAFDQVGKFIDRLVTGGSAAEQTTTARANLARVDQWIASGNARGIKPSANVLAQRQMYQSQLDSLYQQYAAGFDRQRDATGNQRSEDLADIKAKYDPKGEQIRTARNERANALLLGAKEGDATIKAIDKKISELQKQPSDGLAGATNAVARMRAEVVGLRNQIKGLNSDPLSDFSERIAAAGATAAASRTAGKGSRFAGEASSLAEQKEELQIRLQLSQAAAKQIRASQDEGTQLAITTQAREASTAAIDDYWASSTRTADGYYSALGKQADAETEAQVAMSNLRQAQAYGVVSLDDIADAYQKATGASKEDAQALQDHVKKSAEATAATIRLTAAEREAAQSTAAQTARQEQIATLEDYTQAVQAGLAAISAFNREARVREAIKQAGPAGDPIAIRADVGKIISGEDRSQAAERARALKDDLATLSQSAHQAEIMALAQSRMADDAKRGSENVTLISEQAYKAAAAAELFSREMAKLAGDQKTAMRDQFADTGKLNLEPLRKQIATKIRQGVYDAVLAGPINMIVDVAIDVASDGIKKLKDQLKSIWDGINTDGRSGTGNMFENGIGKMLNSLDGLFKKFGGKGGSTASSFLSNTIGGMQVGRAAADAVGATGSTSHPGWQRIMDTAAAAVGNYFGGPIGAAVATFLSRAVGKAILGKESNHGAIASFDSSGNFTGTLTGDKRNDDTSGLATSAATGITQGIAALRQVGATLTTTVTKLDIGTRDTTHIDFSGGQHLETAVGDSEAAIQASLLLIAKSATFADANLQKFADSIENSATTVDELITKLQAYTQAQDFVKSIGTANLQYTNPRAYQLAQLRDAQVARRDQVSQYAAQGFLSASQLAAVNAQLKELEQSEIADVVKNFADSVDGAVHSLADFKSAQADILSYTRSLLTSSLSTLSPTAQLQTAGADFFSQLASAKGGDFDALSNITGTADEYLKQAQGYYGSSGTYAAIFQTVQDALNGLGTQKFDDPLADDIAKASADLQAAILAAGAQIVAAINGANDNLVTTTTDTGALTQAQVDQMITAMTAAGTLTTEQLAQLGEVLASTNWQALSNLASQMAGATTYDRALTGGAA